MIRIILGVLGFLFITDQLQSKSAPNIGGIKPENTLDDKMFRYRVSDNESRVKQRISRNLNVLIANCNSFKIGKTGSRARGKTYNDFEYLIYLCVSSKREYISSLENDYINKYFDHPKNRNAKRGSAGRMSPDDKDYYLYIVLS